MSKISVYKFKLGNTEELTKNIINDYIVSKGFAFDKENNAYRTMIQHPSTAASVGTAVATALLTGGRATVIQNAIDRGLEYYFSQGELIIKVYLINNKMNSKMSIHTSFDTTQPAISYYTDLNCNLIKKLKESGTYLEKKELEKIDDGSEKRALIKTLKVLGLIYGPIILFIIVMILINN